MKKEILIAGNLIAMLFVLLFCVENQVGIQKVTINARYVMLAPIGNTDFRNLVAEGIESADQRYGTDTQLIACSDNEKMADQIDKAVLCTVDGILILGYEYSSVVKSAVERAEKAGIKVVFLDHKLGQVPYDYFVGIDNQKAGVMAADNLYRSIQGDQDSVVITNKLIIENQQLRYYGFAKEWAKLTKGKKTYIIEENGDYFQLKQKMTQLLYKNPELRVFFCAEATSSIYLKDILDSLKVDNTYIMGFDLLDGTLRHVEDGSYQYAIGQDAPQIGYTAISWLWGKKGEKNESTDNEDKMLSAFLVDSTNVKDCYLKNLREQKWLTE